MDYYRYHNTYVHLKIIKSDSVQPTVATLASAMTTRLLKSLEWATSVRQLRKYAILKRTTYSVRHQCLQKTIHIVPSMYSHH